MLKNLLIKLGKTDLRKIIIIFPLIAFLHEMEEWNILPWHRKYNTNVPTDVTSADLHIIFILISVIFLIWTLISLAPRNKRITAHIFFPLMTISFVNGAEHLIWAIQFGVYSPGFIFGFLFEMPLIIYTTYRIFKERLIMKWYSIAFGALAVFGTVNLLLLGTELDPLIRSAMTLPKALSLL